LYGCFSGGAVELSVATGGRRVNARVDAGREEFGASRRVLLHGMMPERARVWGTGRRPGDSSSSGSVGEPDVVI